uniref:Putative p32 protein n=1 Tax=Ixodes ricinus TaxID=34613 RepID=A0A0K8RMM3_IXORI
MDAHRLMLCIWLWLVCASVQCLPRVRLSSRQQIEGETRITIDFYIDDSVDATEQQVKDYLRTVIFTTTEDLQSYFVVHDIHLPYWIKYIGNEPGLKVALEGTKNTEYIYLDGAVDALKADFQDQDPPDIICLVTNYTISNGDNIQKAYGYSRDHTLCKSVVSMLLAYAPDTAGYAGRMLSEMIRASVNPEEVPNLYHRTSREGSFKDVMKKYLSTCNQGYGHQGPPEDNVPPQPPPEIPPGPPNVPEVPDPKPPMPPPPPPTDTTAEPPQVQPQPPIPPVPPGPPVQPPTQPEKPPNLPPEASTPAEPQPDYC